jgi:predicted ATPase/DNA-binding SARP family transcriptional activator
MSAASPSCPLVLSLFGPFQAWVNGVPLPHLRTRKGQWLLALLALQSGRPVERDWLAGILWPDSVHFRESLRVSLKDLRRALGSEAPRVYSPTPRTLALELDGAEVDVLAFDAAIRRGDTISLEQAVDLHRGRLLEGCYEVWVLQERQPREQEYLEALEALSSRAMAQGDTAAAERYLRKATATDPLRESAHRALMQVLAAGGNLASALLCYRDLRLRLHRELHAEPDPETAALFQQLRLEAKGKGDGPCAFPTLSTPDSCPHNLPAQTTALVGRLKETTVVRELLRQEQVRLVTLTGPGGTGKTRLGLQVAADLLGTFRHGSLLVDLSPLRDPTLVASTIAQTLGVRPAGGQAPLDSLKSYLRDREMLLLLDNFEQVLDAAPVVAELLAAAPRLKVLITSRTFLHLRGEHEFPVPPLALPPTRTAAPESLSEYAAAELFIQRARAVRPRFAVTLETAPVVVEICCRLDGLPLAIELAAARCRFFSPQELLARLDSRLSLLVGGARDLPARQRALRSAIGWSHDLLTEAEQTLFRRLAVFVGGFTTDAACMVCGDVEADGSSLPVQSVTEALSSLVEKNLLRREERSASEEEGFDPRFALLETIREYALERLAASGEAETIRSRHAGFFLALAEKAERVVLEEGPEEEGWLARLETEHDNCRAALDWSLTTGQMTVALMLAGALERFWSRRGYLQEGRRRLAAVLERAKDAQPTAAYARALCAAGALAFSLHDPAAAVLLEQSLSMERELANKPGMAASLLMLSIVVGNSGDRARKAPRRGEPGALPGIGRSEVDRVGTEAARFQ